MILNKLIYSPLYANIGVILNHSIAVISSDISFIFHSPFCLSWENQNRILLHFQKAKFTC